jgi:hypothetical protein
MKSYYVYVYTPPILPPLPTHLSRRRFLAALGTKHIIKHAVPDLSHDANLLLNRLRHSGHHEVGHCVEVDAVGVAVVRVGDGKDDGEGRGGDDLGFHDDLVGFVSEELDSLMVCEEWWWERTISSTSGA